jgi:hypothetical protein
MYRVLALFAAPGLGLPAASPVDARALMKDALQHMLADERASADYLWTRRSDKTEFNSDGSVRAKVGTVMRREVVEGIIFGRLVERNGKPLDDIERERNEAALRKRMGELKSMSPHQREKLRDEARKKQEEEDAWLAEAPEALDFKLIGDEVVGGRPAYVVELSPRPGYKPSNMKARAFEKLRGKAWIDKADVEVAKCDIDFFDTVSVGFGVMARIEKGTRVYLQRARVADHVWMPELQRIRIDGRFLLFKSMNEEIVSGYWGYAHKSTVVGTAGKGY